MTNPKPVVVALSLDLGQRLPCPFVGVPEPGKRRLESSPCLAAQ